VFKVPSAGQVEILQQMLHDKFSWKQVTTKPLSP
jgi:hypothetical protein